jgi:hypothetical protein
VHMYYSIARPAIGGTRIAHIESLTRNSFVDSLQQVRETISIKT